MEISQIIELMKAVSENGLTDFSYEQGDTSIKIKKHPEKKIISTASSQSLPAMEAFNPVSFEEPSAESAASDHAKATEADQVVKSPLVGTFYAASSPDAEPFVKIGDTVKKGQVLAIVEAMKLMNEIESDYDGVVKEILAKNGDLIEYDQPLFVIE